MMLISFNNKILFRNFIQRFQLYSVNKEMASSKFGFKLTILDLVLNFANGHLLVSKVTQRVDRLSRETLKRAITVINRCRQMYGWTVTI